MRRFIKQKKLYRLEKIFFLFLIKNFVSELKKIIFEPTVLFLLIKPTHQKAIKICFLKNIILHIRDVTWWRLVKMTKIYENGSFGHLNKTSPCGVSNI